MLATTLRTQVATRVSINIIRTFVALRKFVSNNLNIKKIAKKNLYPYKLNHYLYKNGLAYLKNIKLLKLLF